MTADIDVLSVSEVTRHIKTLLEEAFPFVGVTGEVSNFRHHSSGHMYFSLKDERCQLPCVMWRNQNQALSFRLQDGMQVIARGEISVYDARGQYQLVAHHLQPVGEGALQAAFEQLKARLAAEGLFDESRKRPLPPFPARIGVITAATGAAVRDIIRVLHRRAPWVEIILRSVRVQGEGAAADIAGAIEEMNAYGAVDLLIVGRGGGSMEDLWAFNEEPVVRAIAASYIPVISAVGHEIDYTLADFAADLRAPTPSGAAELAVRDQTELRERMGVAVERLQGAMINRLSGYRQRLNALVASYGFRRPFDLIGQRAQRVDELARRLAEQGIHRVAQSRHAAENVIARLGALNPLAVLERGYAVCRSMTDGRIVRDTDTLTLGDHLDITFHRGRATCRVEQLDGKAVAPRKPRIRQTGAKEDVRLNLFD